MRPSKKGRNGGPGLLKPRRRRRKQHDSLCRRDLFLRYDPIRSAIGSAVPTLMLSMSFDRS